VAGGSGSNGSGLGFEPEPNCGNGCTTWKTLTVGIWAGFHLKTRPLQAQLFRSNEGFEFRSYHDVMYAQIVQFWPRFHILLSNLRSDQYSVSRCRKPANFSENLRLFDSHSTNMGQMSNLKLAGERSA